MSHPIIDGDTSIDDNQAEISRAFGQAAVNTQYRGHVTIDHGEGDWPQQYYVDGNLETILDVVREQIAEETRDIEGFTINLVDPNDLSDSPEILGQIHGTNAGTIHVGAISNIPIIGNAMATKVENAYELDTNNNGRTDLVMTIPDGPG